MNSNLEALYNSLKRHKPDYSKTIQEFEADMQDENNRSTLLGSLQRHYPEKFGKKDLATFSSEIGITSTPSDRLQSARETAERAKTQSTQEDEPWYTRAWNVTKHAAESAGTRVMSQLQALGEIAPVANPYAIANDPNYRRALELKSRTRDEKQEAAERVAEGKGSEDDELMSRGVRFKSELDAYQQKEADEARKYVGEDATFTGLIKQGKIGKALELGYITAIESAPQMAMGMNVPGRIMLGTLSAADEYDRLAREHPDMSVTGRAIQSIFVGAIEQFFESRYNPLKVEGKVARGAISQQLKDWAKRGAKEKFSDLGKTIGAWAKDAFGEGLEEIGTSVTTDIVNTLISTFESLIKSDENLNGKIYGDGWLKELGEEYVEHGDIDKATKEFLKDAAIGYLNDFIGGAMAGGYMGGAAHGVNAISERANKDIVRDAETGELRRMTAQEKADMIYRTEKMNDAITEMAKSSNMTRMEIVKKLDEEDAKMREAAKNGTRLAPEDTPYSAELQATIVYLEREANNEDDDVQEGMVKNNAALDAAKEAAYAQQDKVPPSADTEEKDVPSGKIEGDIETDKMINTSEPVAIDQIVTVNINGEQKNIRIKCRKGYLNPDGTINFEKTGAGKVTFYEMHKDVEGREDEGTVIYESNIRKSLQELVNQAILGEKQAAEAEKKAEEERLAAEAAAQNNGEQTGVAVNANQAVEGAEQTPEQPTLSPEEQAAAEAEAAEQAEEQRVQDIYAAIEQAVAQKGGKALDGLTPEQIFIWRWRKKGGSLGAAIQRAKVGIEEASKIKNIDARDYEIEQWQELLDKYAPQEEAPVQQEAPVAETPAAQVVEQPAVEQPPVEEPAAEQPVEEQEEPDVPEEEPEEGGVPVTELLTAEQETTNEDEGGYSGNNLLEDDVVVITRAKGVYKLAREVDGKYVELGTDKPLRGTWHKVEKKVVYVGDKAYILLTSTDWKTLKNYSRYGYDKEGRITAVDVETGEVVKLDRREVMRKTDKGMTSLWTDPATRQRFFALKKNAKTLEDVLDYVVYSYNNKDGKRVDITLRDVIRLGSKRNKDDIRISDKRVINQMLDTILTDSGKDKGDADLRSEISKHMASFIGDAIRVWNGMADRAAEDKIKSGNKLSYLVSQWLDVVEKNGGFIKLVQDYVDAPKRRAMFLEEKLQHEGLTDDEQAELDALNEEDEKPAADKPSDETDNTPRKELTPLQQMEKRHSTLMQMWEELRQDKSKQEQADMVLQQMNELGKEIRKMREEAGMEMSAIDEQVNENAATPAKTKNTNVVVKAISNALQKAGIKIHSVGNQEQAREALRKVCEKYGIDPELMSVKHGTGKVFEHFDSAYMGSGEGNQAFGWGHYTTKRYGVAKCYAEISKNIPFYDILRTEGDRDKLENLFSYRWLFDKYPLIDNIEEHLADQLEKTDNEIYDFIIEMGKYIPEIGQYVEEYKARLHNGDYRSGHFRERVIDLLPLMLDYTTGHLNEEYYGPYDEMEFDEKCKRLNEDRSETIRLLDGILILERIDGVNRQTRVQELLEKAEAALDASRPYAYILDVEIPDDNGSNYFPWHEEIPEDERKRIVDELINRGVVNGYEADFVLNPRDEKTGIFFGTKGGEIYRAIERAYKRYSKEVIFDNKKLGDVDDIVSEMLPFLPETTGVVHHRAISDKDAVRKTVTSIIYDFLNIYSERRNFFEGVEEALGGYEQDTKEIVKDESARDRFVDTIENWFEFNESRFRLASEERADKQTSMFLSSLGYTGNKVPIGYYHQGKYKGEENMNYIVFKDNDLEIKGREKVEFFKDVDGTILGWAIDGEIYLTDEGMNSETPIHEYTHLWVKALRAKDPKVWKKIVRLCKNNKALWDDVVNDKNYASIKDDEDAVASEVLSRFSGKRGAEQLEQMAEKIRQENPTMEGEMRAKALVDSMKKALKELWQWVADTLGISYRSLDEVADRTLYDLLSEKDITAEKSNTDQTKETNFDKKFAKAQQKLDKGGDEVLSLSEIEELTNTLLDDIRQGNKPLVFERLPYEALQGLLGEQRTLAEALTIASLRSRRENRALVRDEREVGSDEIASRDASQNEMLLDISAFAKEKGMWIEDVVDALDERYGKDARVSVITGKESGESEVWLDKDNGIVIKAKADNYYETLEEFLEGMLINNWIFPENKQTIVGFGIDRRKYHDAIRVVYETPMVDIENSSPISQDEKDSFMANYGFTLTDEQVKHDEKKGQKSNYTNGKFIIGDLHNLNIVRDENWQIRCIDPIIRWVKGEHYKEQTSEQEKRDAENEEKLDELFEFSIGSPDPSDISDKVREQMEKKAERVKQTEPSMATKPAQRLDGIARIIYENQDNTYGLHLLQEKINLWRKEHGKEPIPESQDARSLLIRMGSAADKKIKWFKTHEMQHLNDVAAQLSKKIAESNLMQQFKEDKINEEASDGTKFQYEPTAEDLLERYLIARDNIERAEMKEAGQDTAPRGEEEFTARMGMSMVKYVERVHEVLSDSEINELWDAVRDCTHKSLEVLHESGRISDESYERMMSRQFYVPEKDFAERNTNQELGEQKKDEQPMRRGSRKKLAASAVAYKAKGGDTMATNILANIEHDVQNSIVVSEENKVRRAMYDMMVDNQDYVEEYGLPRPQQEWYVKVGEDSEGNPIYERSIEQPSAEDIEDAKMAEGVIRDVNAAIKDLREELKKHKKGTPEYDAIRDRISDAQNYIKEIRNSMPYVSPRYAKPTAIIQDKRKDVPSVEVYVNGNKYVMTFNGMKEVADALNGERDLRGTMENYKKFNAIVASLFTTYNPTFFAVNIARDVPYILLKGGSEYGPLFMAKFTKQFFGAGDTKLRKPIYQYLHNGDVDTTTPEGKMFYDFIMGGGSTGYTQLQSVDEIRKEFNKKFGANNIAELFAKFNEYSELLTRFAAYKAMIELGHSNHKALNAAKNLSTNFNMKGAGNTFINFFNSLSMFSNAAIQGAAGFYKTFNTPEKAKRAFALMVLSPAFLGFLNTLLCPDDDDDEKEVMDYYRDNYMVFGPAKIPITQELRPFWRIGVNCALGMQGRRTGGEMAQSIVSGFTEHLLPIPPALSQTATGFVNSIGERGLGGGIIQGLFTFGANTIFPQYADGVKELISNKDFMGNEIVKSYDWSDMPQYTANKSEAELYKDIAYGFYLLGGGDSKHPSRYKSEGIGNEIAFDWSPKVVHKALGVVGSTGALQMICSLYGLTKAAVRSDVDVKDAVRGKDIPLWGTFVRPEEKSMYRYSIYKETNDMVKAYKLQLKGYNDAIKKASDAEAARLTQERDAWVAEQEAKGFNIKEVQKMLDAYKASNAYNVSIKLGQKEEDVQKAHPEWEDQQKRSVQAMNEMLMEYNGIEHHLTAIEEAMGHTLPEKPKEEDKKKVSQHVVGQRNSVQSRPLQTRKVKPRNLK